MKIVIAPDSFKESLPAAEVAAAIEAGLREVWPDAEYVRVPMADGGEGTVELVTNAAGGTILGAEVTGPMGAAVRASFGVLPGGTAVLEMASASGLEFVPAAKRNPLVATSFGSGELIAAALDTGASRILLGIGGSATVDGGAGMLQALGATLLDRDGRSIPRGGAGLTKLDRIELSGLDPRLAHCRIDAAADVDNPLTGPLGAAAVFGPQKGATPEMVGMLEAGLENFARVIERDLQQSVAQTPGAGAAGGLGAALIACLGATLRPGAELVAELVGLDAALAGADLVFTGEGRIDGQTIRGKTAAGVAHAGKRHGVPVVALAGHLGMGWEQVFGCGIDAVFSIANGPSTPAEAYAATALNLRATARNVAAIWKIASLRTSRP